MLLKNTYKGFTLLEILIALAVFAILATITSTTLYHTFNTRARLTTQSNQLMSLQLALSLLERDITQIVNRPTRKTEMQFFQALIGQQTYTEFTRGGLPNPGNLAQRSTLVRVKLLCTNHQLIRRSWPVLDTLHKEQYDDKVLLTDLNGCQFAYLTKNLQVLPKWHESVDQQGHSEPLPKAIQLTLIAQGLGKLSLLFTIPKAMYAHSVSPKAA